MSFSKRALAAGINRTLTDTANPLIKFGTISGYGWGDIENIRDALEDWQQQGVLTILGDLNDCSDEDDCVEFHGYIGSSDKIPRRNVL